MRLIDADKLVVPKYEETGDPFVDGFHQGKIDAMIEVSTLAPTIDPESLRPKGRWEDLHNMDVRCSACGFEWFPCCQECGVTPDNTHYCPNCGAKMMEE